MTDREIEDGPYWPRCDCAPWPGKCPYCGEDGFARVVDTGDELHQILGEALRLNGEVAQ